MSFSSRKALSGVIFSLIIAGGFFAAAHFLDLGAERSEYGQKSIEVGIAALSPSGESGGYGIPASEGSGSGGSVSSGGGLVCATNAGSSCTSGSNFCGQTLSGTIQCDGTCGATTPSNSNCPQCNDGIDNDGGGSVDYPADPDCTSPTDNSEFTTTAPFVDLSADPTQINAGDSSNLSFTVERAMDCVDTPNFTSMFSTANDSLSSDLTYSGTAVVSPGVTTTYSLSCSNLIGTTKDTATVNVDAPTNVTLTANPVTINLGESSELSWSSQGATDCTGSGFSTGGATSGSVFVSPGVDTQYEVTCTNANGSTSDTATVFVNSVDLVISSFTVPGGTPGELVVADVFVKNAGSLDATGDFEVAINRNTGTMDCSTAEDARAVVPGGLVSGGILALSIPVTLPGTPGDYTATAMADSDCAVVEGIETNNTHLAFYTVADPDDPDLVIDAFSVPSGAPGDVVSASVTIRNQGTLATPAGTDFEVAIRANGTVWCGFGKDEVVMTSPLAADASRTLTLSLTLPTVEGSYLAGALVDSTCIIDESDNTNNRRWVSYTVSSTPKPDLVIYEFIVPDGAAGASVDATVRIRNQGTAGTGSGFEIAVNPDGPLWCTAGKVKTVNTTALAAGGERTVTISGVTLPSAEGIHNAAAMIDSNCSIGEIDEGNNWATDSYLVGNAPTANLLIDGNDVPGATYNSPASYTLSWTSTNASSCAASGDWSGAKPVSGSESFSGVLKGSYTYTITCSNAFGSDSDSIVVTVNGPDLITSHRSIAMSDATPFDGQTITFTSSVKNNTAASAPSGTVGRWCIDGTTAACAGSATPSSELNTHSFGAFGPWVTSAERTSNDWTATEGNHTVYWCADVTNLAAEENENNNCHSRSFTVIAPPVVDLKVDGTDGPLILTGSGSFTLSWAITGFSSADSCAASGAWSGSKDPAGGSEGASVSSPGSYGYTLTCSNAAGSGSDSVDVFVNALSGPDLVPVGPTASPNPVLGGQFINFNGAVKNNSATETADPGPGNQISVEFRVDFGNDGTFDVFLTDSVGGKIQPGKQKDVSASWQTTQASLGGNSVVLCVDYPQPGIIAETNEANNCSAPVPFTVTPPQCSNAGFVADPDDDGDTTATGDPNRFDTGDPGCYTDFNVNNATYDWSDNDEGDEPACVDGIDNDGDGRIDAADPACHTDYRWWSTTSWDRLDNNEGDDRQCSNLINDDPLEDAFIDWDDDGCWIDTTDDVCRGLADPTTSAACLANYVPADDVEARIQCTDGLDNDGDGRTDWRDPGCWFDATNDACSDPSLTDPSDSAACDDNFNRLDDLEQSPSPVAVTFRAVPAAVIYEDSTTIEWEAALVRECRVEGSNGDAFGPVAQTSGPPTYSFPLQSDTTSPLTITTTYTLWCRNIENDPEEAIATLDVTIRPFFEEF